MKELKIRYSAKLAAVILLFVMITATILFFAAAIVCSNYNYYYDSLENLKGQAFLKAVNNIYAQYCYFLPEENTGYEGIMLRHYENSNRLPPGDSNLLYSIENNPGTYDGESYIWSTDAVYSAVKTINGKETDVFLDMTFYIKYNMSKRDIFYFINAGVEFVYAIRFWVFPIILLLMTACIFLIVFIASAAGHKRGIEGIHLTPINRIPFDIQLLIYTGLIGLLLSLLFEWLNYGFSQTLAAFFIVLIYLVFYAVFISLLTGISARVKSGKWWKNTVVCMALSLIGKVFMKSADLLRTLGRGLPFIWQGVIGIVLIKTMEFVMLAADEYDLLVMFWVIESIILIPFLILLMLLAKRLERGAEEIAKGNVFYKIDDKYMFGRFKTHAENLSNIGQGINNAVEERMKSERFKTELISNVSHDIKTPLTSIINYVDLLEKEQPQNTKSAEYLEILKKHTARLKKLTEDLIEASKASSGSIEVDLTPCELGVMITQSVGEYTQRFEENNLELIVTGTETKAGIKADRRHLWRIFDNLLGNILKYSQPSTRVYINLETEPEEAKVIFRNISGCPVKTEGESLGERFVRGDMSRSTEGHGLGLAIAKSLTEIQGGNLGIIVDGDLFKVTLCFPLE